MEGGRGGPPVGKVGASIKSHFPEHSWVSENEGMPLAAEDKMIVFFRREIGWTAG